MEVVPSEQLPLRVVVVHHAVVAILVLEGHGDGSPGAGGGVERVVDGGVCRGVAGHRVQASAHHESVGHCVLPDVCLPALPHLQALGIQLGNHDRALCLAGAVDGPQAPLVCRQVDVGVAAPGVRVLAVEARVRQVSPRCQALGGQVVTDQGAAALALVVKGAAVHGGPCALHRLWQHQHLHREALGQLIHVFVREELADVFTDGVDTPHGLVGVLRALRLGVLQPHSILPCNAVGLPVQHRISHRLQLSTAWKKEGSRTVLVMYLRRFR